jgi:putative ABC transport system substrate-binding protein
MWASAALRCFILTSLIMIVFTDLYAGEKEFLRAAILISKDIKPYLEAAEGIHKVFDKESAIDTEIFSLEKNKDHEVLKDKIAKKEIAIAIAIGPESLALAESIFHGAKIPVIYAMVLNPETILRYPKSFCGIPFNIPIRDQIPQIARALPGVKRLGLLYDPKNNEPFFKQAFEISQRYNIVLIPLKADSPKDISFILKDNAAEALWLIPDRTIISESVIQYIIKEALLKKIPVIGYNRFFYESGAALSFVFDYEEIGEQTAKFALDILAQKTCADIAPIFHVWLNSRIIRKIGIPLINKEIFPIEIKP